MPLESTERLAVLVLIAAPEAPISPALEVRLTVVAVKEPEVSEIPPAALRERVPAVPGAAATLPLIVIFPLVVIRLKVSPEPTVMVEPVRVTLPLLLM